MRGLVAEEPAGTFAGILRQLRGEARLTQEELAEAAGLSPRSVSDLERGVNRTARKDTAGLLADALGLTGPVRAAFVAAARGRAPAAEVLAARDAVSASAAVATRTLPRDIASFTGRESELARLIGMAARTTAGGVVGIHAIGGMAGIGKTTFAVHAAHQLAPEFPDGQVFLPLHGHTPGQRPVDPADALASLLLMAGVGAAQIPPGLEARAAVWRDYLAGKKILLLLDDAAGHEQVTPLLPGAAGSLVLVTSRRRLAALEDAAVISLDTMSPGEAATLLARLAGEPGVRAGDAAVGEITRLCGYLPLAIGMLASRLRHHPARTASDLAADIAAARDRLAVMRAENLSLAAAFDLSYQALTPGQQRFFRHLGLVPGPSVDAYAFAALADLGADEASRALDELYDQHLLNEPAPGRYQLHDLVREHARALAAAENPAESDAATVRLLDYYLHTALAATRHFASWIDAYRRPPAGLAPAFVPGLSTLQQAVSWLDAERPNLHAAVDYAAASGRELYAVQITNATSGFLRIHGYWDQSAALHQTGLSAARQANDPDGEADTLIQLGALQRESGDYRAAAASLARAMELYGELGDRAGESQALNELGFLYALTGDYQAAAGSHRQALALAGGLGSRTGQADALTSLGLVQQLTGDYPAAAASQRQALAIYDEVGNRLGMAHALNDLGVVQRETADYPAAAASQQQALKLFRDFGERLGQAYALNDLGVVQQETADYPAAAASHRQALNLFRDLGNRLGQAEVLNNLGELTTRSSAAHQQARDYHTKALAIAREISAPMEEARALEGIGRSHLQGGNPGKGAAHLQQALTVYQRIGAPAARRVQATLRDHGI
jgi:tetratricopeptide (TPR) repeat protein/transcriptional regulator with XRE-family HTH domain